MSNDSHDPHDKDGSKRNSRRQRMRSAVDPALLDQLADLPPESRISMYRRLYYERNKERICEKQKQTLADSSPETLKKLREARRRYYVENRERILLHNAAYRARIRQQMFVSPTLPESKDLPTKTGEGKSASASSSSSSSLSASNASHSSSSRVTSSSSTASNQNTSSSSVSSSSTATSSSLFSRTSSSHSDGMPSFTASSIEDYIIDDEDLKPTTFIYVDEGADEASTQILRATRRKRSGERKKTKEKADALSGSPFEDGQFKQTFMAQWNDLLNDQARRRIKDMKTFRDMMRKIDEREKAAETTEDVLERTKTMVG
jgi:cobalamin biosynthesis Mg chelatase CobN